MNSTYTVPVVLLSIFAVLIVTGCTVNRIDAETLAVYHVDRASAARTAGLLVPCSTDDECEMLNGGEF